MNSTKEYVDIDETIFKHALFLFSSYNAQDIDGAVETSFKKFATKEFVTNMAVLFDLNINAYKTELKRRIVNAFNSGRLKQKQLS